VTDAVTTILAAAAVVLQALLAVLATIGVAAIRSRRARQVLAQIRDSLLGNELWIAWTIALIATAGSLFYSEHAHFVPCRLCWYQRIGMYPLSVLLLIAALRRDVRGGVLYGFPLAAFGALIAIYHVYIEYHPEAESASCRIGAPCSTKWIEELGYVTLPVLALTAFAAIMALLAMAWSRTGRSRAT
jgi:disulfide bond formation protein DsbB